MAKKQTSSAATGLNPASETSPTVEAAIIAEATAQIANAKGHIKETKKLGKAIAIINQCSPWGCDQLSKAITARLAALRPD